MASDSPFSLEHKTILVTGASSGIGRATATLCAELGATVIACGRDTGRLDQTLASLPGSGHRAVTGDLTDPADRQALVDTVPVLDGCVFSAGVASLVPVRMVSQRHIDAMFALNYNSPVLLTQALLSHKKMRQGGASLVYVTAVADHMSPNASSIYAGAKAALTATVKTIAVEHARQGIRANCVSPGFVNTPMMQNLQQISSMQDKLALTPLGPIEAADIAAGIAYLLAPASRWISRTSLVIDGGITLHVR